jgi:hypothetical protein
MATDLSNLISRGMGGQVDLADRIVRGRRRRAKVVTFKPPAWATRLLKDVNEYTREEYGRTMTMNWKKPRDSVYTTATAYDSWFDIHAGTDGMYCRYVMLHEAAHVIARWNGKAKGWKSSGEVGGSCDGHCTGFYETLFGEVLPRFKPRYVPWKLVLQSEYQYKPRNAFKVAKQLKVPGAKSAWKQRKARAFYNHEDWRDAVGTPK